MIKVLGTGVDDLLFCLISFSLGSFISYMSLLIVRPPDFLRYTMNFQLYWFRKK